MMDRQQTSDEWDAMLQKRKAMTDDTLREECEELAKHLQTSQSIVYYTDVLLAFARAQQAKGLREAATMIREHYSDTDPRLCLTHDCQAEIRESIKAQATAREQAPVPYPGWCRQSAQCQGKVSCPLDPTCAD